MNFAGYFSFEYFGEEVSERQGPTLIVKFQNCCLTKEIGPAQRGSKFACISIFSDKVAEWCICTEDQLILTLDHLKFREVFRKYHQDPLAKEILRKIQDDQMEGGFVMDPMPGKYSSIPVCDWTSMLSVPKELKGLEHLFPRTPLFAGDPVKMYIEGDTMYFPT